MPTGLKRGRWTKGEMVHMRRYAKERSLDELAVEMQRDPNSIAKWIEENMALDISGDEPVDIAETEIRNELRESAEWEDLKDQFVESELKTFERKYAKFMSQFKSQEVFATEESQIFMLIKYDILMGRNLKARQRALIDIERIQKQLDDLYESAKDTKIDQTTRDQMINLENQLASAKEAEQSKTTEYTKLTDKYNSILKDLKGTREQRVTKIENSKKSFLELIKMLQEEEMKSMAGEDMELMRMAGEKEKKRLVEPHKYVDDVVDQPLLTPETVINLEE